MSKIRVCDRCGKKLDYKSGLKIDILAVKYNRFRLDTESEHEYDQHDLCPDCMDDYKAFIEGAKIAREENP